MSRTMIISSWPTSKTASTTASGSSWMPENTSRYMSATRRGVSLSPCRPGSSPIPSRIRRTPSSTFWASKSAPGSAMVLGRAASRHRDPRALASPVLGRPLLQALQQLLEVLLLDGLPLDQGRGDLVELGPLGLEDVQGVVVGLVDQPPDLAVDLEGHLIRVVRLGAEVAAQEHLALLLAEGKGPELVGHAVLGDHLLGDLGG